MSAPALVVGTGGSGTRITAQLMLAAGVHLGPDRNPANDTRQMTRFLRLHARRYLEESQWIDGGGSNSIPPPADDLLSELKAAIDRLMESAPDGARWGAKNPPNIYVLPLLDTAFGDARVVQFVRDGRDMAYSSNQNQLEVYGELVVGDLAGEPDPVRSIALWSRMNLAALSYAREHLEDRHMVLRYEDICADPRGGATRLLEHLELPVTEAILDQAEKTIAISASAGRWRDAPEAEREAVTRAGAASLSEFGYVDGDS